MPAVAETEPGTRPDFSNLMEEAPGRLVDSIQELQFEDPTGRLRTPLQKEVQNNSGFVNTLAHGTIRKELREKTGRHSDGEMNAFQEKLQSLIDRSSSEWTRVLPDAEQHASSDRIMEQLCELYEMLPNLTNAEYWFNTSEINRQDRALTSSELQERSEFFEHFTAFQEKAAWVTIALRELGCELSYPLYEVVYDMFKMKYGDPRMAQIKSEAIMKGSASVDMLAQAFGEGLAEDAEGEEVLFNVAPWQLDMKGIDVLISHTSSSGKKLLAVQVKTTHGSNVNQVGFTVQTLKEALAEHPDLAGSQQRMQECIDELNAGDLADYEIVPLHIVVDVPAREREALYSMDREQLKTYQTGQHKPGKPKRNVDSEALWSSLKSHL